MSEFRMPSLGADMEAGTLVEWLKAPGDKVARGDIVAVVETQKGAIEVEIFEDGVLDRILVEPGRKVPVGTPLALVRAEGEPAAPAPAPPPPSPEPAPAPSAAPTAAAPPSAPPPPPSARAPGARLRVSPAARQRAETLAVDLSRLAGSGPEGAITLADVEAAAGAAPAAAAAPAPPAETPQAAMRQAIAAAMARANRDIPHYFLAETIDMTAALDWLEAANRERGVADRLLHGVLFLKATALALKKVPDLNGFWREGAFAPAARVNVGWAVSLRGGGLIAPAILDADQKPLDALMRELRDLVRRARAGGLRSSEMSEATVTVTSLGDQGSEAVYGVIYPPQVALVGFGRIVERPWVVDGAVAPRRLVSASLAGDHRASDGHRGGLLLSAVARLLQEPESL